MLKQKAARIGLTFASSLIIVGCGAPSAAPSHIFAKVGRISLTKNDIITSVNSNALLNHLAVPHNINSTAQRVVLIQQATVQNWALTHHVVSVIGAKKQANIFITKKVASSYGGSPGLSHALARYHLNKTQLQTYVAGQFILQDTFTHQTKGITSVPAGQAHRYYRSHVSEFSMPAMALVREIVVKTHGQATGIVSQLRRGANFAALARRESSDKKTAMAGGALGWVDLTSHAGLPANVLASVKSLHSGQYSIVPIKTGYAILEVQTQKAGAIAPYTAVRPEIIKELIQEAKASAFQHWVRTIKKSTYIKTYSFG